MSHGGIQFSGERIAIERNNHLHVAEDRVIGEDALQIDGGYGREPAVAVHDGGHPTQLLDRFEYATCEEDGTLVVVGESLARFGVGQHRFASEVVVVIDEVDLHAR